jgi:hypothetical protein
LLTYREDLDEEEYEEMKKDTIDQLKEFSESLNKMKEGNMTLVDDISRWQLATQAAISEAFKTPEVIRMFAKRQPGQLRQRLNELERDSKIGKISNEVYTQQAVEILAALKRLGEKLSPQEVDFMSRHTSAALTDFQHVTEQTGTGDKLMRMVSSDVERAKK